VFEHICFRVGLFHEQAGHHSIAETLVRHGEQLVRVFDLRLVNQVLFEKPEGLCVAYGLTLEANIETLFEVFEAANQRFFPFDCI
jgi:hypothetical protein